MSGSMETSGPEMEESLANTKYVSCIRIYGQPILPPVMTAERREEMRFYRSKAEEVEKKLQSVVRSVKSDSRLSDVTEREKQVVTIGRSSSVKRVDPHEILEEFDPFAPTAFSDMKLVTKFRHSGSSDEFFASKTDSSNNSVAMTNSTDLYHYIDMSGTTRTSLTSTSTPGTTTGSEWSPSPTKESTSSTQQVKTTYEGLNDYLDRILQSFGPTPSDHTVQGHDDDPSNEESTPTNAHVEPSEGKETSGSDFQEQLNRREASRPASCPLSPTPQRPLGDSAIESVSGKDESSGSPSQGTCAEEKLIDFVNERKVAQSFVSSKIDTTVPRLVRSNSYTLESPSPMLLAHLEAEKRKNETSKPFTNMKQHTKNLSNAQKKKNHVEKAKNGTLAPRRNEGQTVSSQGRKDNNNQASKAQRCQSPPSKATNLPSTVTPTVSPLSTKNNRNGLTQAVKSSKTVPLSPTALSKTPSKKKIQQKESVDDDSSQVTLQESHKVLNEQFRKIFVELQAAHNRQMEELLSRQRMEQELIRQAVLRQKDLFSGDIGLVSDAEFTESHSWASLLRTNSPSKKNSSYNNHRNAMSNANPRQERRTPPQAKDENRLVNEPESFEESSSVTPRHHRNYNFPIIDLPSSQQSLVQTSSASVDLIEIHQERSFPSANLSSSFLLSQFTNKEPLTISGGNARRDVETASGNTNNALHRAASMSETYIDILCSERNRTSNQVSSRSNTSCDRPSSSPALRDVSTENDPRASSSACDALITEERAKAIRELPRKKDSCSLLVTDLPAHRSYSNEMLPNPYKDANGNLAQTNDLNCKNLLVSLDANKHMYDSSSAVERVSGEILSEDGVLTCYSEVVAADMYPVLPLDTLRPVTSPKSLVSITAQVSPRGRRKAWSNRQPTCEAQTVLFGDPEWLESSRERQRHWAATKIQAGARGYLVRRLLRTERVQNCITVIHDTILCALQLQKECGRNVEPSDLQLHGRLIHQLSDACREIHRIFIELPVAKRLAIISVDRERLQTRSPRSPSSHAPRPLSRATQIVLKRKMMQNSQNNSPTSGRRKNWITVDSPRSSRPTSSILNPESSEALAACMVRSASSPVSETTVQRSSSSTSIRKPWR